MTREEAIEKIINGFCNLRVWCELYPDNCQKEDCEMWWAIEALSADRPTGEWVSNHDGTWNCSECGLRVFVYAKGNYCPNCGAKMESGEE